MRAADDYATINAKLRELEGAPIEKPAEPESFKFSEAEAVTFVGHYVGGAVPYATHGSASLGFGGGSGNAADINSGHFTDDLSAWDDDGGTAS